MDDLLEFSRPGAIPVLGCAAAFLVHPSTRHDRPALTAKAIPAPFEFGNVALNPTHDGRVRQIDAPLSHHLDEISEAQFEPEIPTHTENNDLPIEMAAISLACSAESTATFFPGVRSPIARLTLRLPRSNPWPGGWRLRASSSAQTKLSSVETTPSTPMPEVEAAQRYRHFCSSQTSR